jgi:hypothetical protein
MNISKVFEYLKDIRILSVILIAIFIIGLIYSKCVEGMTVAESDAALAAEEAKRNDFDQTTYDASFNALSNEEKLAKADEINTTGNIGTPFGGSPDTPVVTTEQTEAEKRAQANVINGQLSTICPEGCKENCPNADLKCLQSMHPRCVNCEAKMKVGDHKIVGNIGENKQELPIINININTENGKGSNGSVPAPFSSLESYNIGKKGHMTDDTASATNNMYGSKKNPGNIISNDVTPQASTGQINGSQTEINNQ